MLKIAHSVLAMTAVVAAFAASANGSAFAQNCPGSFIHIVNGTRTAMVALQIREAPRGPWQEILQGTPLGVQRAKPFCLSQGRYYDIKAEFQGGLHVEKPGQPLGGRQAYIVTEY